MLTPRDVLPQKAPRSRISGSSRAVCNTKRLLEDCLSFVLDDLPVVTLLPFQKRSGGVIFDNLTLIHNDDPV